VWFVSKTILNKIRRNIFKILSLFEVVELSYSTTEFKGQYKSKYCYGPSFAAV
jgi:hypothetical protein